MVETTSPPLTLGTQYANLVALLDRSVGIPPIFDRLNGVYAGPLPTGPERVPRRAHHSRLDWHHLCPGLATVSPPLTSRLPNSRKAAGLDPATEIGKGRSP